MHAITICQESSESHASDTGISPIQSQCDLAQPAHSGVHPACRNGIGKKNNGKGKATSSLKRQESVDDLWKERIADVTCRVQPHLQDAVASTGCGCIYWIWLHLQNMWK